MAGGVQTDWLYRLYRYHSPLLTMGKKIGFTDPELDASYQRALKSIKGAGIDLRCERHSKKA